MVTLSKLKTSSGSFPGSFRFAQRVAGSYCGQRIAQLHEDRADESQFFRRFILRDTAGQRRYGHSKFTGTHGITSR